jgi:hypothetical protein
MRQRICKELKKVALSEKGDTGNLITREDGSKYYTGFKRYYKNLKKQYRLTRGKK